MVSELYHNTWIKILELLDWPEIINIIIVSYFIIISFQIKQKVSKNVVYQFKSVD